jgi:hypothetical protein
LAETEISGATAVPVYEVDALQPVRRSEYWARRVVSVIRYGRCGYVLFFWILISLCNRWDMSWLDAYLLASSFLVEKGGS